MTSLTRMDTEDVKRAMIPQKTGAKLVGGPCPLQSQWCAVARNIWNDRSGHHHGVTVSWWLMERMKPC